MSDSINRWRAWEEERTKEEGTVCKTDTLCIFFLADTIGASLLYHTHPTMRTIAQINLSSKLSASDVTYNGNRI